MANEYVPVPSSSVYFVDLEKVFPIKNKYHLKSLMPGSIRIYPLDTRRELKVHETFTLREKSFPHFLFPHSNWIWRYDQNNSKCKHFLDSVNLLPVSRGWYLNLTLTINTTEKPTSSIHGSGNFYFLSADFTDNNFYCWFPYFPYFPYFLF